MNKQCLKASELVARLQQLIAENGDLEVTVDTQEGGTYNLYSQDDVKIVEWTTKDGSKVKSIDIG